MACRAAVEGDQVSPDTLPRTTTLAGDGPSLVAAAGEHELEVGPLLAQEREGLEEALVVLVRPRSGRVEEKRLALPIPRCETAVVDAERDRVDALGRDAEPLDHAPAHELAVDNDDVSVARRALIREAAVGALGAAEELGQVEVLEIEERDNARCVDLRHGDRERVVEHVDVFETAADPPGPSRGERHRERTFPHAVRNAVLGHRHLAQSFPRSRAQPAA